jgi:hypothetical protein
MSEGTVMFLETGTNILTKSLGASALHNYVQYMKHVVLAFGTKVPALSQENKGILSTIIIELERKNKLHQ